jgi:ribosomal protein L32E
MMPNGFYKFKVHNAKELDMLLMHNTKFAVEISHNISSRNRKSIVERSQILGLFVTNKNARVSAEEAD